MRSWATSWQHYLSQKLGARELCYEGLGNITCLRSWGLGNSAIRAWATSGQHYLSQKLGARELCYEGLGNIWAYILKLQQLLFPDLQQPMS